MESQHSVMSLPRLRRDIAIKVVRAAYATTPYDVKQDGRFMINRFVERTAPPATVILNWSASTPQ